MSWGRKRERERCSTWLQHTVNGVKPLCFFDVDFNNIGGFIGASEDTAEVIRFDWMLKYPEEGKILYAYYSFLETQPGSLFGLR